MSPVRSYSFSHCFASTMPNAANREQQRLEKKRALTTTVPGGATKVVGKMGMVVLSRVWIRARRRAFVPPLSAGSSLRSL